MKLVFKKDDVAHMWANQIQQEGRNAGGNFYFTGNTIFSYGAHFPIAKHVTNKRGDNAVLFTFRKYGNTTAKQIGIVDRSINHLNKILCYCPGEGHIINLEKYFDAIKGELSGLATAKKPEKYINPANYFFNECIKYCKFFGIKVPANIKNIIKKAESGKYSEYLKKESARINKERIKREKEALKMHFESLDKWRAGKGERLYSRNENVDYLRHNGKRVETSQGVEIPTEIAKRAFTWILNTLVLGGCEGECKYKIMDYEVKSLDTEKITIGCHVIKISEIKALAIQLKW